MWLALSALLECRPLHLCFCVCISVSGEGLGSDHVTQAPTHSVCSKAPAGNDPNRHYCILVFINVHVFNLC